MIQHEGPVRATRALRPFAESSASRALELTVEVSRQVDSLAFTFELIAPSATHLEALVISPVHDEDRRHRRDGLWHHTCLELFVAAAQQPSYFELNLSPSGDWNVYAFESYRAGGRPVERVLPPLVQFDPSADGARLAWHGLLRSGPGGADVYPLEALWGANSLVLGATAVLEYASGHREYWALAHAGEKPDFHLRESFVLSL